jgi:chromosome segregation ATPase
VIKANAEAEAHEMRQLKNQADHMQKALAQYDLCMQEMRKLNLRNTESANEIRALIEAIKTAFDSTAQNAGTNNEMNAEITEKISGLQKIITERQDVINDIHNATKSYQEALSSYQNIHDELQKDLEEAVHKENVKVYRNIQAVIIEEVGKQTQTLTGENKKAQGMSKALLVLVILLLITGLGNLAVMILQILGIF